MPILHLHHYARLVDKRCAMRGHFYETQQNIDGHNAAVYHFKNGREVKSSDMYQTWIHDNKILKTLFYIF